MSLGYDPRLVGIYLFWLLSSLIGSLVSGLVRWLNAVSTFDGLFVFCMVN